MARRCWILTLKSWEGMCLDASHWYGTLWLPDLKSNGLHDSLRLEYALTAEQADILNKQDGWPTYDAGETVERFLDYESALAVGLAEFEARAQNGNLLLANRSSNPTQVHAIRGDDSEHFRGKLNAIWKAYDAAYRGGTDWTPEHDRLLAKWDRLLA